MSYPTALKQKAHSLRQQGLSYRKIGLYLNVHNGTIRYWLNPVAADKLKEANAKGRKANPNRKRIWYQNNLEHCRNYQAVSRSKRNRAELQRKQNDPNYRLAANLRSRLSTAIRGHQKAGSAVRDLGCSIHSLKQHLESQFQNGMNWDNYGEWHIDHKKPLASFDLTNREQLLEACHYTNLQPLWAADNMSKGAKRG